MTYSILMNIPYSITTIFGFPNPPESTVYSQTKKHPIVCSSLLNFDIFKINKIRHPERYEKFLNRFKEQVKRFAHKDYVHR